MKFLKKLKFTFIVLAILFIPFKEKSKEVKLHQTIIEKDLRKKIKNCKRVWTKENIIKAVDALYIGERVYDIDYRFILAFMEIETDFYIYSTGYNKDKLASIDYGVCQINTQSLDELYERSEDILTHYKICNLDVKNYYDIHLNDYRKELIQKKEYSFMRWIQSYNCGINGSSDKETFKHLREKKAKYYVKFVSTTIGDKDESIETAFN